MSGCFEVTSLFEVLNDVSQAAADGVSVLLRAVGVERKHFRSVR